jgi:SAM-dependent methyltransferase
MGKLEDVGSLYERRPYPAVSVLSSLLQPMRRDDLPLLNYQAGYASCYGSLEGSAPRPRILVAGCGTFEPVAVALANPAAEILAVDLSARSLEKLRWQARLRGLSGRIRTLKANFEELAEGEFDYVIATGVLHHLENPGRGLAALVAQSKPRGLFRMMLYSRWGRDLLYGAKDLLALLGAKDPASVRLVMASLPADHPYRIYFHLYSDAANDAGLADGYLHPCDQPFTAHSLRDFLEGAGLPSWFFLHRPEGQPAAAEKFADFTPGQDDWDRLAVLDALGQLEENFCLFAGRAPRGEEREPLVWNPALPRRGRYFSKLLGELLEFDQNKPCAKAQSALFQFSGGSP